MIDTNITVHTGRLGQDPEQKFLPSGKAVCNFSIAVNRGTGDNQVTDWHDIVAFDVQAENVAKYVKKGSRVLVEGRLQKRSYDGKDGRKVFVTEIVAHKVTFLDTKSSAAQGGGDFD